MDFWKSLKDSYQTVGGEGIEQKLTLIGKDEYNLHFDYEKAELVRNISAFSLIGDVKYKAQFK